MKPGQPTTIEERMNADMKAVVSAYSDSSGLRTSTIETYLGVARGTLNRPTIGHMQISTYERVMRWFSDHWPKNVVWPKGTMRPPKRPPAGAGNQAAETVEGGIDG